MGTGGAERVAANLANAWAERGDRVTLLVTYSSGGVCDYTLSDKVELKYLATEVGHQGRGLLTYMRRFLTLRKHICAARNGVVVSFLTNVNVAALLAGCCIRTPIIVCERSYPPMLPVGVVWDRMRRWTYPHAAQVVMQTRLGLSWLNEEIHQARGRVIPNPIFYPLTATPPHLTPSSHVAPGRKILLAVGRLSEEKGFDLLLDAFARLAPDQPDWDLVMLGEGTQRAFLEAKRTSLRLDGRVHMPGRAGNVGDWYSIADLYVMSSRVEGFPNTLGEAMAHGCASVSFDCNTGPRDLIRHGEDGYLVRPVGDVDALTNALCRLMGDHALRAQMASKAIEVTERYSMGLVLDMWDRLIDEVASKPSASNLACTVSNQRKNIP